MTDPFETAVIVALLAVVLLVLACRRPKCPFCGQRDWDTDSFPKHVICKTCRSVFHG